MGSAIQIFGKLCLVADIVRGIHRKDRQVFSRAGQSAAQYRLVNKIHAKSESVAGHRMTHVIAQLVLFLVSQDRKSCDRRGELVVTKGFESGSCESRGAERKCQGESQSWLRASVWCK